MGHTEKPLCDVCQSAGRPLYHDLPDLTFSGPHPGSLQACSNSACGTVWANPFPDAPTIAAFYENYYTHSEHEESPDGAPAPEAARIAKADLKSLIKNGLNRLSGRSRRFTSDLRYLQNATPGRLLDVGCGNGRFLAEAAAGGWTVFGQEFDPVAADIARRVSGAEVEVGSLTEIGYETDTFDAVTLSNVLEHLPNPKDILNEIHRILAPGGLMVSLSPNPRSYLHVKYGAHWRGLEVPRHLFLFPPAALKRMATDAGFDQIETFSALGAFLFMEEASAQIRQKDQSDAPALPHTPKWRRLALHAATVLGGDQGEWSVIIAEKDR